MATGKDCLVDVFGGSGKIAYECGKGGFSKIIYNDINEDITTLFKVLQVPEQRRLLLKMLKWQPISRKVFEDDYKIFKQGGNSFSVIVCPIERAAKTFYRLSFSFGGKYRSGGFSPSTGDRKNIKEVYAFRRRLKLLARIGSFFRNVVFEVENRPWIQMINRYGRRDSVVFFCDPPYPEYTYYVDELSKADHVYLSHALAAIPAPVICTFYDSELIRELYPEDIWKYEKIIGYKNLSNGRKTMGIRKTEELILSKKMI